MASKANIDTLVDEDFTLSKSLDEELMTIQSHRRDGTVTTKEIELGDTMRAFEQTVKQRRAELESLAEELRGVNAGIAAAKNDVLETEKGDVRKARDVFNAEMDALAQEAYAIKEDTLAEVKKARKEDKAATADTNRKLEEFMESML